MTKYEKLLSKANDLGINVYEDYRFKSDVKALIVDNGIALSYKLKTENEKYAALLEEMKHYEVNVGNITNLRLTENARQENKAHTRMVFEAVPLPSLINAAIYLGEEAYIENIAQQLDVSVSIVEESIEVYSRKYSGYFTVGNLVVTFDPQFHIYRKSEWEEINFCA